MTIPKHMDSIFYADAGIFAFCYDEFLQNVDRAGLEKRVIQSRAGWLWRDGGAETPDIFSLIEIYHFEDDEEDMLINAEEYKDEDIAWITQIKYRFTDRAGSGLHVAFCAPVHPTLAEW